MSQRIDKSWVVFASIESHEGDRCVDLFARPDGSYGFEEFRRDPEDGGEWTPVLYFSTTSYRSGEAAIRAAEEAIEWLAQRLREQPSLRKLPSPESG
ncbi:MAG: hypothetical protein ACFCUQ_09805 [Kiloniellales bacterium]